MFVFVWVAVPRNLLFLSNATYRVREILIPNLDLLNLITGIFVITSQKLMKNVRLYALIQVATESYKSEPKIVNPTTPLYGRVNNFQTRGLHSILQENTQKPLCNVLFQSPNVRDTNPHPFVIISI